MFALSRLLITCSGSDCCQSLSPKFTFSFYLLLDFRDSVSEAWNLYIFSLVAWLWGWRYRLVDGLLHNGWSWNLMQTFVIPWGWTLTTLLFSWLLLWCPREVDTFGFKWNVWMDWDEMWYKHCPPSRRILRTLVIPRLFVSSLSSGQNCFLAKTCNLSFLGRNLWM